MGGGEERQDYAREAVGGTGESVRLKWAQGRSHSGEETRSWRQRDLSIT